jgi:superfamily I DNA/RNA helicase
MKLPIYEDLSKEQDKIYTLPLDESFVVTGPPGTGKTVMALYRADMLRMHRTRVNLLMYSRLLTQYTQAGITTLQIDGIVQTYHKWLWDWYKEAYSAKPPRIKDYVYDWMAILERVNSEPPNGRQMSHLIVDEGQDLPAEAFMVLPHLAKNLSIFADENQRLTDTNSTISQIRQYSRIKRALTLSRNYRNTRQIADLAAHFYTGLSTGIPDSPDRDGDLPEVLQFQSTDACAERILNTYLNNPKAEIGVFVPTELVRNAVLNRLVDMAAKKSKLRDAKEFIQVFEGGRGAQGPTLRFGEGGITLLCYASAKGLEFDIVFIPELQRYSGDPADPIARMTFYVLISRARKQLYLCYSGTDKPKFVAAFPANLIKETP